MNKIFTHTNCISREEFKEYINNSLVQEERTALENHLLDCPLCSDAYEGLSANPGILRSLPENWMTTSIVKDHKLTTVKSTSFIDKSWFRIAASILSLTILTIIVIEYKNKPNNQSLYAESFTPLPPVSTSTRSVESGSALRDDPAMVNFGLKDYSKATTLFEEKLKTNKGDLVTQLYLGICYLEIEQLAKAEDMFKRVQINSDDQFNDAAWYLALCYLKMNKPDKTKELLNELIDNQSDYGLKAKELLTRLDQ